MKKLKSLTLIYIAFGLTLLTSCAQQERRENVESKQLNLLYSQGTRKLIDKEYTEALDLLLKAYKIEPKDPELLNNLAMAYYFKGRLDMAEKYLLDVLELNPAHSDAKSNLGSIYFYKKDFANAEKYFLDVSEDLVYPNQYRVYYNLGLLYLQKNNRDKAIEWLNRSAQERGDYCPVHFKLGALSVEEGNVDAALSHFREGTLGACVNIPFGHYQMGLIYFKQKKYKQALDKFEFLVNRFPKAPETLEIKGKLAILQTLVPAEDRSKVIPTGRQFSQKEWQGLKEDWEKILIDSNTSKNQEQSAHLTPEF